MTLKPNRIPSVLPEVLSFRTLINTQLSSSISQESLQAVDRFVRNCRNFGIWDKLIEVYPFVGADLTAATAKLKYNNPSLYNLSAVNMVSGDYIERGSSGGVVGNGTTKYLNAQFFQSSLPAAGFLAVYLREAETQAPKSWLCANTAAAADWASLRSASVSTGQSIMGGGAIAVATPDLSPGLYAGNRSSSTRLDIYKNGVSVANAVTSVLPAYADVDFFVLARSNNGAPAEWTTKRISFAAIGSSMTAAEHLLFYQAVQNLQTELSRNV